MNRNCALSKMSKRLSAVLILGLLTGVFLFIIILSACTEKPPEKPSNTKQPVPISRKDIQVAPGVDSTATHGLLDLNSNQLKASDAIDTAMFKRVMEKHRSSFKVCYRKALIENPNAHGEVRVRFNISPTGRVSTIEIKSSALGHKEAEDCLIRVIRHVRFPKLESGRRVTVEYPLVFVP